MGHFGACGEGVQGEVAQVVGIPHGHVHLEVVGASHMEDREHLGQAQDMLPEGLHLGAAVLPQLHGDEGLEAHAQGFRVHLGMGAQEDALGAQALGPGQAVLGCQTHRGGQFLVG